jgi:chemotaxis protein methyltransferase CheR
LRAAAAGHALADDELFDLELDLLLEALMRRYQYDFRHYARASLKRRVRQALSDLQLPDPGALQHRVMRDADLFARLLQYLTVQVSDLFRDPAYFKALRDEVVPELRTWPSIKLWVAGCGHGEEVWSLLVLLHEEGLLDRSLLYATDIDTDALERAEAGVFPLTHAAQFSRNYRAAGGLGSLSDHFTQAYGGLVFDRALRRHVVFADHSLATDSVFSEVHLVSCRNVLIYFDRELQDRAVGLFRDALVRRGFLGLGSRETLRFGAHADDFAELPASTGPVRLYQRR